jgi:hypothetical protein
MAESARCFYTEFVTYFVRGAGPCGGAGRGGGRGARTSLPAAFTAKPRGGSTASGGSNATTASSASSCPKSIFSGAR